MKLAPAYVFVTTNAAVGTDQDGETFWKKIRDNFIQRGGLAARSLLSLKNRFNKIMQAEVVNQYVGYLHAALREYHSGWSMNDYTTKAKSEFQTKHGKFFKHDIVYNILRRSLPKYKILLDTIHPKVGWALALVLLDNDNERALERDAIGVAAKFPVANITALLNSVDKDSNSNVPADTANVEAEAEPVVVTADTGASGLHYCAVLCDLAMTPRPSIGKKNAKAIAQQAAANIKMKVQLPSPRVNKANNVSREHLASAAEAKNKVGKRMALAVEAKNGIANEQLMMQAGIANEQLMMQVFLANPQSVASIAFLPQSLENILTWRYVLLSRRQPTFLSARSTTFSKKSQILDFCQTHKVSPRRGGSRLDVR